MTKLSTFTLSRLLHVLVTERELSSSEIGQRFGLSSDTIEKVRREKGLPRVPVFVHERKVRHA